MMKIVKLTNVIHWCIVIAVHATDNGVTYDFAKDFSRQNLNVTALKKLFRVKHVQECSLWCAEVSCKAFSYYADSQECYAYNTSFCSSKFSEYHSANAFHFFRDEETVVINAAGCVAPRDCQDVQTFCSDTSGVYTIYLDGNTEVEVYCDMETDNGGWTVFQRRMDGSEDFFRTWIDYKVGFGDRCGEYWLGNDNIHSITANQQYKMRVDLEDFNGTTCYAEYQTFNVKDEISNYTLKITGYSGTCGNSMKTHNRRQFSARDNDLTSANCTSKYKGGWWYHRCHGANLNGLYLGGNTTRYAEGVVWSAFKGHYHSLKTVSLKLKRNL